MKTKTKSLLALGGTLVIGMVLGGLLTFGIVRNRVHDLMELRYKGGFSEHLMEVIRPSPEQEVVIQPLLESFGEEMESMHKQHREESKERLDDLKEALDEELDNKQMKRVNKWFMKMHRKRPGPKRRGKRRHRGHH